jgi:serine/threonine protein kinase
LIPPTILFVASDAVDRVSQIKLIDEYCCPELDRWLNLKKLNIAIDFRRIHRVGFDIPYLRDYIVNVSVFEESSMICDTNEVRNEICHRNEDEFSVLMKSIPLLERIEKSRLERELEKLINLRHPCIAAPIGFVIPVESGSAEELKIVRMYFDCCSLSEVISINPNCWTSTVKAKAVAGIVLGLRFAHSLGMVHGHLTARNILFDCDHCIQIIDFKPIVWGVGESEIKIESESESKGKAREGWTPERDIQAFASIFFEIVFGHHPQGEELIPTGIPYFVWSLIESGLFPISGRSSSFNTILDILKQNKFAIQEDVDSEEVSAFVSWVESAE